MPENAPLHVLGLVGDALRDVFGRMGGLVRIAWPYYALAAAFAVPSLIAGRDSPLGEMVATIVGGGVVQLILSLAVLACVIRWQRHIVLDEPLRGTAPLGWPVLRYTLWSLVLGLVCLVPVAAAALVAYATGAIGLSEVAGPPFTISIAGIALLVCGGMGALLLFARLNLVLPAASVEARGFGLRRSWRATRGHGLRLVAVFLVLLLGLGLLAAIAGLVGTALDLAAGGTLPTDDVPATASLAAGGALNSAMDLIAAVVGASVTARLYRQLVPEGRPPISAR